MKIYFIKTQYTNNIYKIEDFYLPTGEFRLNENKQFNVNFKADDISSIVILPSDKLLDNTSVKDYTHIIVPLVNKVYSIVSFQYINEKQLGLTLSEDPFIANYQTLKSKKLLVNRNNTDLTFNGIHDVRDVAIEHTSSTNLNSNAKTNSLGVWVAFTFQEDANPVFNLRDIANYPTIEGYYDSVEELDEDYPETVTNNPFEVSWFLKFAENESKTELFQAVYVENVVMWVRIRKYLTDYKRDNITQIQHFNNSFTKYIQMGDIGTKVVLFPIDATLVNFQNVRCEWMWEGQPHVDYQDIIAPMANYYNIADFTDADKLLSVKLIGDDWFDSEYGYSEENLTITLGVQTGTTPRGSYVTNTTDEYFVKSINEISLQYSLHNLFQSNPTSILTVPSSSISVNLFKTNIPIRKPINSTPTIFDYEPFKKYFLFAYGEMVEIPAKYAFSNLNMRLAFTSQETLYEIYTTRHNVIASGRLNLNMRWTVDKLAEFYNQKPTYKDQWWTQQATGAFDRVAGGAMAGASAGGIYGAALGAGAGLVTSAISIGTSGLDFMFMEKGLKDKADSIYGINDVAMTWLKGFGLYWVVISPDTQSLTMMENTYQMTGHPTNTYISIDGLLLRNNPILGAYCKVVMGSLNETIVNNYVTGFINSKLAEGVIII